MSVGRLPTPSHPPGGPQSLLAGGRVVGSLPTAAHRPGGTPPSEGGVPPPRWAEPNYPSVINKPAATRPDASDNSMTEATSMLLAAVVLRLAQRPVHLLEGGQ